MNHKYIEEIMNIEESPYGWSKNTGRDEMWEDQRREYGFDERETWSLDATFFYWLYERLRMFNEVNCINTEFHTFEINGKKLTQQECIDIMIAKCKDYITHQGVDDNYSYNLKNEILDIWKECIHAMWW